MVREVREDVEDVEDQRAGHHEERGHDVGTAGPALVSLGLKDGVDLWVAVAIELAHAATVTSRPLTSRITIEPGKRGGKPCIRGLGITVYSNTSRLG